MNISNDNIIKQEIMDKPVHEIWRLWSTHEGLRAFFGQDNNIDLTIGGAFEIYFLMDNPYGTKGSEGCKVLSFVPEKQFVFSWNAPPHLPEIRNADHYTWVVIDMESVDEDHTKVTLTHCGFPADGSWHEMYDYFDRAWGIVMTNLKEA